MLRHVMYTIMDRYYMTMKERLGASLAWLKRRTFNFVCKVKKGVHDINELKQATFLQAFCITALVSGSKLCFVICVEDYHKLTQTQFLIQSPLGNLTSACCQKRRLLELAIFLQPNENLWEIIYYFSIYFVVQCNVYHTKMSDSLTNLYILIF